MKRYDRIQEALTVLNPVLFDLKDESHRHAGRAGTESHFRIRVVSDVFDGVSRPERHRKVHALLAGELAAGLHAVTLQLLTRAEAEKLGLTLESPQCAGKSRGD